MRVRIKTLDTISKSERIELEKYVYKRGMEIYNNEMIGCMGRCYKLFAVCLHAKYGFGKQRIMDIFTELNSVNNQRQNDPIFWKHIDDVILKEIKLDLPREKYNDLDK